MVDVVTPEARSRMMAGIRGKNTKPELALRSGLHRLGFRFKLYDRKLPGKPDLVFPKWNAVIFVHGCFWHGHDCHLFKWPATRTEFWRSKIQNNRDRDRMNERLLLENRWRVGTIWECAFKGPHRFEPQTIADSCSRWLRTKRKTFELLGDR